MDRAFTFVLKRPGEAKEFMDERYTFRALNSKEAWEAFGDYFADNLSFLRSKHGGYVSERSGRAFVRKHYKIRRHRRLRFDHHESEGGMFP